MLFKYYDIGSQLFFFSCYFLLWQVVTTYSQRASQLMLYARDPKATPATRPFVFLRSLRSVGGVIKRNRKRSDIGGHRS